MLDTKIADNDGGSFSLDGSSDAVSIETLYSGDDVPGSYRIADEIYHPSTLAYGSISGTNPSISTGSFITRAITL